MNYFKRMFFLHETKAIIPHGIEEEEEFALRTYYDCLTPSNANHSMLITIVSIPTFVWNVIYSI